MSATTMNDLKTVVLARHDAEQRSPIGIGDNVLTFQWAEMHLFDIALTLHADGSITETTDGDAAHARTFANLAAYDTYLVELFSEEE